MKLKFDNIRKSFVHVFGGSVLTENFFLRNMRFILVVVLIMILFISHRYAVLQQMSEIERLERVLKGSQKPADRERLSVVWRRPGWS